MVKFNPNVTAGQVGQTPAQPQKTGKTPSRTDVENATRRSRGFDERAYTLESAEGVQPHQIIAQSDHEKNNMIQSMIDFGTWASSKIANLLNFISTVFSSKTSTVENRAEESTGSHEVVGQEGSKIKTHRNLDSTRPDVSGQVSNDLQRDIEQDLFGNQRWEGRK